MGLPLKDIREALESLPDGRTPTKRDWSRLSLRWRKELDERIAALQHLRNDLDGCIGCGCLSLKSCTLQNLRTNSEPRAPAHNAGLCRNSNSHCLSTRRRGTLG